MLRTLRYLAQFPAGIQVRSKVYRYAPLQVLRYHLVYSIEGMVVVVHRVRRMYQRPLKRYFVGDGRCIPRLTKAVASVVALA